MKKHYAVMAECKGIPWLYLPQGIAQPVSFILVYEDEIVALAAAATVGASILEIDTVPAKQYVRDSLLT